MKRILTLLGMALTALPLCAHQPSGSDGQSTFEDYSTLRKEKRKQFWADWPYRYECRIGWGGYPMMVSDTFFSSEYLYYDYEPSYPYYGNEATLDDMYGERRGNEYLAGVFQGEFAFHLKSWFSLALDVNFTGMYGDTIDPYDGQRIDRAHGISISLMPQARFYWSNRPYVRAYSSVGLGIHYGTFRDYSEFTPSFQFVPVGITAGRKVFFFAEYSFGTAYLGGVMGIGYRF